MLFREGCTRFPQIATQHPDEEFYGVFFDCDVVYTGVLAHLNTNALLRQTAMECQSRKRRPAGPLYPGLSTEQVMEELRWDGGSWGHFEVFHGPNFKEIAEAYDRLQDESALKENFMRMACRAVVRMERSGVFDCLRRTSNFRVLCVYVRETVEDGDRRLNRVRRTVRANRRTEPAGP
jgi:hypothetical protein